MSADYVPAALRRRVAAQAGGRRGYCRSAEVVTGMALEIEHIIPLNRPVLVAARGTWISAGLHPPTD